MKNIIYYIQYLGIRGVASLLSILPNAVVYAFAKGLGIFVYHILRIRRKVSMDNLTKALGHVRSQSELAQICRDSYINIGMTMIEILLIPRLKKRIRSMVDLPDLEILRTGLSQNRGVIIVTAHFGSWELPGPSLAAAGFPVAGVGARLSNHYLNAYIKNSRTNLGVEIITKHQSSLKSLVKALRKNRVIGLVSDQNAGQDGVFVYFFGRPCSTPTGAAKMALRYNTPMLMMLALRTGPGRYRLLCQKVDVYPADTVETLTQRYTTMTEDVIRQYPEQYFWMHRRWKTKKAEVRRLKAEG